MGEEWRALLSWGNITWFGRNAGNQILSTSCFGCAALAAPKRTFALLCPESHAVGNNGLALTWGHHRCSNALPNFAGGADNGTGSHAEWHNSVARQSDPAPGGPADRRSRPERKRDRRERDSRWASDDGYPSVMGTPFDRVADLIESSVCILLLGQAELQSLARWIFQLGLSLLPPLACILLLGQGVPPPLACWLDSLEPSQSR